MTINTTAIGLGLLAATLAACTTDDAPPPTAGAEREFVETSVTLRADGPPLVEQRPLYAYAERAQNAARARILAGHPFEVFAMRDSLCAWNSFWLYDALNLSGDRICFSGTGLIELHDYWITIYSGGTAYRWYWNQVYTGSFWPGNYPGSFDNVYSGTVDGPSDWTWSSFGPPENFSNPWAPQRIWFLPS